MSKLAIQMEIVGNTASYNVRASQEGWPKLQVVSPQPQKGTLYSCLLGI